MTDLPTPCTIGRASQFSATPEAARNMPPSEAEVTAPWPSPAIDRRPPSQCRLRHVKNRDHFQPLPRDRKKPLINGGESPPAPSLKAELHRDCPRCTCNADHHISCSLIRVALGVYVSSFSRGVSGGDQCALQLHLIGRCNAAT